MPDKNSNVLQSLFSKFSFKPDSKGKKLVPLAKDFDSEGKQINSDRVQEFPSYVKNLYAQWQQANTSTYAFEDRRSMYSEMDNMYEISPLMTFSKDLLIQETVQADTHNQIVLVEAKDSKQKKHCEEALIRLNIDGNLYPMYNNLVKYGDAAWINTFYDKGVAEILNVDPYDLDDRIEFTPHDVEKELRGAGMNSMFRNLSNNKKMQVLMNSIMNDDEYASFFRSYLFGFQVGSFVLPPWRCMHFRNFETNSYFAPFGTPAYVHALAPVKMYDMALGLAILARQVKMPTEIYNLKFPMGGMPTDKIELATGFMRAWQASGIKNAKKEQNGMGNAQITIEDLFSWEMKVPDLDLGQIEDIELLEEQVRKATQLPRNFLDPDSGSFGNSGINLIQQFKPFARKCYKYQTIGLEQIAQLLKIDMIQSGKFKLEEIDFKLSMPYPESQHNPDIASSQRDLFGLANEVLDGIKDRLDPEGGVALPADLIKQVYQKVGAFDPDSTTKWIDMFVAEREKAEKESAEMADEGGESSAPDFTFESFKKRTSPKLIEKVIQEEIVRGRIGYATEHASGGRHYLSSRKNNLDFDMNIFEQSNGNSKFFLNEELKISNNQKFNSFKKKMKKSKVREQESKKRIKRKYSESVNLLSTDVTNSDADVPDIDALNEGE